MNIELIPGNGGRDCPYNGSHSDENGKIIECCFDECDYLMLCVDIDKILDSYPHQ